jgi:hypothetical protein
MGSLWLSFPDDHGGTAVREPIRRHLDGRLTPELVDDILLIVDGLVRDTPQGGELIVSHRDDAVLIEVLSRSGAAAAPAGAHASGTHPASTGNVVWVEVPAPRY